MFTVLTILAASLWWVFLLQFGCWGSIREMDRDRGRLDTGGRAASRRWSINTWAGVSLFFAPIT